MQFNVGDRVRVVARHDGHDEDWVQVGAEFRVMYVSEFDPDYPIMVAGPGSDWDYLSTDQLELVSDSTVFKLQVPEEPAGVDRVRPVGVESRFVFSRDPSIPEVWSEGPGYRKYGWRELLERFPNGVEPVPSDFEVSLDYLRRNAHLLDGLEASGVTGSHAAAVVRGVLEREGSE